MQFLRQSHEAIHNSKHPVFIELEQFANSVSIIDNHAHPFCDPDLQSAETIFRLDHVLTEGTPVNPSAPSMTAQNTLTHLRSVQDMCQLFRQSDHVLPTVSIDPRATDEDYVEGIRASLGLWPLANICFTASKISAVLIDDGLSAPINMRSVPYYEMQQRLPISVAKRVLRLETEAEHALSELVSKNEQSVWQSNNKQNHKDVDSGYFAIQFRTAFRNRISPLPKDVVSFKTIAAYRSTLEINLERTNEELDMALREVLFNGNEPVVAPDFLIRLKNRIIIDVVVKEGLQVANENRIPIQVHCGFGDTDVDILKANPALLRNVFHKFPHVSVVLLHAAWPYAREAAFLAASYARVYVDFGLSIPLLSISGMVKVVEALFEIAPFDKIMYSSDAHSTPDVFFLASKWGRKILAAVTAESVLLGDMSIDDAKKAIYHILNRNAVNLYGLSDLIPKEK